MYRNPSMLKSAEILGLARKEPFMTGELKMLHSEDKKIPGSVTYSIRRFQKNQGWNIDDMALEIGRAHV